MPDEYPAGYVGAIARASQGRVDDVDDADPQPTALVVEDGGGDAERTSWDPIDLAPLLSGEPLADPPTILTREGGPPLFYARKVNDVHGEPETGKGWVATLAVVQELRAGNYVGYLDFENDPGTIVGRLLAFGLAVDVIAGQFRYMRPDEPLPGPALTSLSAAMSPTPTLVVVDGVTDALDLHGFDPNSNKDVAKFRRILSRPLASAGPAVLEVDHVTKDAEARGKGAIGAQHKRAGIDGASYEVQLVHPFGRGRCGMSRIVVRKDKPGFVRAAGDRVGEFHLASDPDGTITIAEIRSDKAAPDAPFRPTALMERVSRHLEAAEDPMSQRAILDAVTGKRDALIAAIDRLVAEGFVDREKVGKSTLHRSARPFREATDGDDRSPVPPTVPNVPPGNGLGDRSQRSPGITRSRGTGNTPTALADPATVPPGDVDDPAVYIAARRAEEIDRLTIARELDGLGVAPPADHDRWTAVAVAQIEGAEW